MTASVDRAHAEIDTDGTRRLERNELLFRSVNAQLRQLAEQFDTAGDGLLLVCECGDLECTRRLHIPESEYRRVRAEERASFVAPSHEQANVPFVAERHSGYSVVIKQLGMAADMPQTDVEELD